MAWAVLIAAMSLIVSTPVAAASSLQNPSSSPPSGTTDTIFVFSVDYVTTSSWEATSVWVEIVGLGGGPLPMSRVDGTDLDGTWQSNQTMLPEGNWELVFSAQNDGPPPQQPAPISGPTVIVNAPTPSPSPGQATPTPGASPTPVPSATPPASPRVTPAPTPLPTPLPPGVTPAPTPIAPFASPSTRSPDASGSSAASASPSATHAASAPPSGTASAPVGSSAAAGPTTPPASSTASVGGESGESGWAPAAWVVLGGLTSAAGAAVLLRQWLAARGTGTHVG